MNAFRVVALAYALSVFLIAPAWLAADDATVPQADLPAVAEEVPAPAPAQEPAPEPQPVERPPVAEKAQDEAPAQTEEAQPEAAEPEQAPEATAAASASVTITDFEFTPASVTVNVGDTVTWTNEGPTEHSATANDGSFDTGIMPEGGSGSHTFTEAGTIAYICTPHPFMEGTVVVQGDSAGSDGDDGSDGDSGSGGGDDTAGDDTTSDDTTTTTDDDGSSLPDTGAETPLIALLGLATLGFGLLLRRRAEG